MSFLKELAISIPILIVVAIVASHIVVVPTGSMAPSINEGDMVLAEKVDVLGLFEEFHPETVKEGDIIIYEEPNSSTSYEEEANSSHGGEMIIHRVININESQGESSYTLKGDANLEPDEEKVHPKNVKGKILTWNGKPMVIPHVGWLILWFKGEY